MSLATCISCELPFVKNNTRNRICLVCWKRDAGYELTKGDLAHEALAEETKSLLEENKRLRENSNVSVVETLKRTIKSLQDQLAAASGSVGGFTPEMLKKLIILCHPDKHNNNPTATEVTKTLLALRSKTQK